MLILIAKMRESGGFSPEFPREPPRRGGVDTLPLCCSEVLTRFPSTYGQTHRSCALFPELFGALDKDIDELSDVDRQVAPVKRVHYLKNTGIYPLRALSRE
jgi:hypothetical protein